MWFGCNVFRIRILSEQMSSEFTLFPRNWHLAPRKKKILIKLKHIFLFPHSYIYVHYYICNVPSLDVDALMVLLYAKNWRTQTKRIQCWMTLCPRKKAKNMQKGLMTALWPWHVLDYWEIYAIKNEQYILFLEKWCVQVSSTYCHSYCYHYSNHE